MSGTHRTSGSRRKPKKNNGRVVLASAVTGGLALAAGGAAFVILGAKDGEKPASASAPVQTSANTGAIAPPTTGKPLMLKNTEGFAYKIAAVTGGTKPTGEAYIDYTLTNTSGAQAPLEAPGDLFIKTNKAGNAPCAEQEGAWDDLCTLKATSEVVGYVGTSQPPVIEGEDQYMPPGASYMIRLTSAEKVAVELPDLALFVYQVRFIPNRVAMPVSFP